MSAHARMFLTLQVDLRHVFRSGGVVTSPRLYIKVLIVDFLSILSTGLLIFYRRFFVCFFKLSEFMINPSLYCTM